MGQQAHLDPFASLNVNKSLGAPEAPGFNVVVHHAQAQPLGALGAGPGFEVSVKRLREA